eukprot:Rmarinus@m.2698
MSRQYRFFSTLHKSYITSGRRIPVFAAPHVRRFCSKEPPKPPRSDEAGVKKVDPQSALSTHVSIGQKAAAATKVTANITISAFFAVLGVSCLYYVAKALLPSVLSPQRIAEDAFELVRGNHEAQYSLGEPLRMPQYGGSRRHSYTEPRSVVYENDDGVECTQVTFIVQGSRGQGVVVAEREESMGAGQFSFISLQTPLGNTLTIYPY